MKQESTRTSAGTNSTEDVSSRNVTQKFNQISIPVLIKYVNIFSTFRKEKMLNIFI